MRRLAIRTIVPGDSNATTVEFVPVSIESAVARTPSCPLPRDILAHVALDTAPQLIDNASVVDTNRLSQLAQSQTREEFIAQVSGMYLVLLDPSSERGFSEPPNAPAFHTHIHQRDALMAQVGYIPRAKVTVLPIAKSPNSPYQDRISVGRSHKCDLPVRDASVSKLHGYFFTGENGELQLVDVASSNGTLVNRSEVEPHKPIATPSGTRIVFGTVKAIVADPERLYDLLK